MHFVLSQRGTNGGTNYHDNEIINLEIIILAAKTS